MSDVKATKDHPEHEGKADTRPSSSVTRIARGLRRADEIELDFMRKTLRKSTGDEDSVLPALSLSLTLRGSAAELGPRIADALTRYDALLAPDALRSVVLGDDVARLTERRIAQDRATLRAPTDAPIDLWYASTPFGAPGDFGVRVRIAPHSDAGFVRFAFPWRRGEGGFAAPLIEDALSLVAGLPVDSGTFGLGFEHWHFDRFARDHVNTLLERFFGFHHSVPACEALGSAPSPSWLTFLGPAPLRALGGRQALEAKLTGVPSRMAGEALVLQASQHPPVGDLEVGARDLGALPDIARALEPASAPLSSFGGNIVMLDPAKWSRRLLGLASYPFENR